MSLTAAIMQPYFFPYIGYFQLMQAVDTFVFLDDAQFIKGGWVNRNQIRSSAEPIWLSLPVQAASASLYINQRVYQLDGGRAVEATLKKIRGNYLGSPWYSEVFPMLEGLLCFHDHNVARFNANLLQGIARLLGMGCRFISSSSLGVSDDLRGQDRVIAMCDALGADRYINAIGGTGLYSTAEFAQAGVELKFPRTTVSPSVGGANSRHLSIVDLLMMQGVQRARTLLDRYELIGS